MTNISKLPLAQISSLEEVQNKFDSEPGLPGMAFEDFDLEKEFSLLELEIEGEEREYLLDKEKKLEKLKEIVNRLPNIEHDFIDLYYFKRVRQVNIAEIFKVSQPMVCYRLKKAIDRIKFLLSMPELSESQVRKDLRDHFKSEKDLDIIILMYKTTCESRTAQILGTSQSFVRHRFIRAIQVLEEVNSYYHNLMSKIMDNLNILKDQDEEIIYMVDNNQYS
jgi:DNA-directed RNA polymerase specialized sigma subunit